MIHIILALVEILCTCNKGDSYRLIENLFKFRKRCFDIFGNVLVCNMFENVICYSVNLSCCL